MLVKTDIYAEDEEAFKEVLHRLKFYEGMPQFDEGLKAFRELCVELRRRGRS